MKNNLTKLIAIVVAILMTMGTISPMFTETSAETSKKGSITIHVKNVDERVETDISLDDSTVTRVPDKGTIEYTIYLRAKFNEVTQQFMNPKGIPCQTINVGNLLQQGADFLNPAVLIPDAFFEDFNGNTGFMKKSNTEGDGSKIVFDNLPLGRYIVIQTNKNEGTTNYNHFLVDIPGFTKDPITGVLQNQQNYYDINVFPKNTLLLKDLTIKSIDGESLTPIETFISIEKTAGTKAESSSIKKIETNGTSKYFIQDKSGNTVIQVPGTPGAGEYMGLQLKNLQYGTYVVNVESTLSGYTHNTDEIEFKVARDGVITLIDNGSAYSHDLKTTTNTSGEVRELTIKNYKPIDRYSNTLVNANQIKDSEGNGGGNAYFHTYGEDTVKWQTKVEIPRNIIDYESLKVEVNLDDGFKFNGFTNLNYNGQSLLDSTNAPTVEGKILTMNRDFIDKNLKGKSQSSENHLDLILEYDVQFNKTAINFDQIEYASSTTLTYSVAKAPSIKPLLPVENVLGAQLHDPINILASEKMVTGNLTIEKIIQEPTGEDTAADVEFILKRTSTNAGDQSQQTHYLKLEQVDGVWFVNDVVAAKNDATVLSPDTHLGLDKGKAVIKVFGLLISDKTATKQYATYELEEINAPAGYNKITRPIDVSVSVEKLKMKVSVYNRKGLKLPATGGLGISAVLLGVGTMYILGKRKDKKEEELTN